MNYIQEINSFDDWHETNQIPKSAIALWNALMQINNKAGWATEFEVAISTLESKTGFKRSELFKGRNVLQQKGRIKWTSRGGNLAATYQIIPFGKGDCVHNTDASGNANGNASGNASGNTSGNHYINYTKLNKTKQDKRKNTKKEKILSSDVDVEKVYKSYPATCPIKRRSTGKCQNDKLKIEKLLQDGHTVEELTKTIAQYVEDCGKTKTYVKNFSTFLNNLPDYTDVERIDINADNVDISTLSSAEKIDYVRKMKERAML